MLQQRLAWRPHQILCHSRELLHNACRSITGQGFHVWSGSFRSFTGQLMYLKHATSPSHGRYTEFAAWQRTILVGSEVWAQQLDYWKRTLAGAPPLLELPTDYPRPEAFSSRSVLPDQFCQGRALRLYAAHLPPNNHRSVYSMANFSYILVLLMQGCGGANAHQRSYSATA
jgi:hypothetical protein